MPVLRKNVCLSLSFDIVTLCKEQLLCFPELFIGIVSIELGAGPFAMYLPLSSVYLPPAIIPEDARTVLFFTPWGFHPSPASELLPCLATWAPVSLHIPPCPEEPRLHDRTACPGLQGLDPCTPLMATLSHTSGPLHALFSLPGT